MFLYFPDSFALYNEQKLPQMPDEPQPPKKPSGRLADIVSLYLPGIELASQAFRLPDVGPRNVSSPQIRQTNSYDVNIHVKQLKHNRLEDLGSLCVVFDSYEEANSFSIDYEMVAANIPKPDSGKLHVIVRKVVAR